MRFAVKVTEAVESFFIAEPTTNSILFSNMLENYVFIQLLRPLDVIFLLNGAFLHHGRIVLFSQYNHFPWRRIVSPIAWRLWVFLFLFMNYVYFSKPISMDNLKNIRNVIATIGP